MKKVVQLLLIVIALFMSSCEQMEQIQPPTACMDLSKRTFLVGETIEVYDCSQNTKVSYFLVNDKIIGCERTEYNYTFEEAGEYEIKLVSYNRSLRDALALTVTVEKKSLGFINVITAGVDDVTEISAVCGGEIETEEFVVSRGLVYGYNEGVSLENRIETLFSDSGDGQFIVQMQSLLPNTLYYVKAFAQVGDEYFYGQLQKFSTQGDGTTIILNDPSNITSNSAYISGEVSEVPSDDVFEKGIVYSTDADPIYGRAGVYEISFGDGLGEFNFELTGLNLQTTYYVKAYAFSSNSEYFYSQEKSFVTIEKDDQFKSVNVKYANESPRIDGVIDVLWYNVEAQPLNVPMHGNEMVSFNNPASFKALWDDDYIYILVEVPDDDFYPASESGQASWLSDKPELYFDVNENKKDGGGPSLGEGHYQFAPSFTEEHPGYECEYGVSNSGYQVEYAISYELLTDNNESPLNPYKRRTIGFDLTIIDLDEEGKGQTLDLIQRVNWSNDDLVIESWTSLDKSGNFNFIGGNTEP